MDSHDDERQLRKRFTELADRADARGCYTFTDFLDIAQLNVLMKTKLGVPFVTDGGYEGAERRLACFGDCGYDPEPPIACVKITLSAPKFSKKPGHRDFLGSLIALGVRREALGDILVSEDGAFLFCLESVAGFIEDQLERVGGAIVHCERTDAPSEASTAPLREEELVVSSERLDAAVAAVYGLSRGESQGLISQGKVYVNSRAVESTSFSLSAGEIVSVRGVGRFIYRGVKLETRKGRLRITVGIY